MKKLISFALVAIGLAVWIGRAEATVGVRSPKESVLFGYSTAISSVTSFTVLESTTTSPFVIRKPGAVYQVILSSGVANDFCVLYDTSTAVGLTPPTLGVTNLTAQFGPRLIFGSTSQSTTYTFDPPIIFFNGLMVGCTALQDGGFLTYEQGRGLSGQ